MLFWCLYFRGGGVSRKARTQSIFFKMTSLIWNYEFQLLNLDQGINFIISQVLAMNTSGPVGSDQAEEGKFFWMSTGKPLTYENWNTGEPNNYE